MLGDYVALFRHLTFACFVLQSGFCTASFLVTATAASSLMKEMLHRPSAEFGLYFLLFPFGFLSGNFVTSRIGTRVANETMVLAGSVVVLITVLAQASVQLSGYVTPLTLFMPGFFLSFAQGISLPYAQAGALETNPKLAGTAAGIGVFMQNFAGALFAQLYGAARRRHGFAAGGGDGACRAPQLWPAPRRSPWRAGGAGRRSAARAFADYVESVSALVSWI